MRRAVRRGAALAALAVAWRFGTLTHALGGSECVVDARGAVAARRLDLGARGENNGSSTDVALSGAPVDFDSQHTKAAVSVCPSLTYEE